MSGGNGGPAFPHQDSGDTGTRPGMTLRQYYAAKAMQGLIASGEYKVATAGWIASESHAIATAMIAEESLA